MRIGITMAELKKINIIRNVVEGKTKGIEAAELLGFSKVHISRLKKKYIEGGPKALIRKRNPSPKRTKDSVKEKICGLKTTKYYDFNMLHFLEKINEDEGINISYETLRKILIEKGLHNPKKRKVVHRRRRRMPEAGMLIQMDSSQHQWINTVKSKWWLTAAIDDATSQLLKMKFFPSDGVFNNMEIIRKVVEHHGVFYALYVDRASHFKTTRLGGLHVEIDVEQKETNIERALKDLDITLITAKSPQAKGRVERLFGTLQDRLIAEMRLRNIKSYKKANEFIENYFIKYYNDRFAKNTDTGSVFKPLNPDINLDLIFCKKFQRKVNMDNTIKFMGRTIQLIPTKHKISFVKHIVDICLLQNAKIFVLYKDKIILETMLPKRSEAFKKFKKIEALLEQRTYLNA